MTSDTELEGWILAALRDQGGGATIVQIAKHIWSYHEADLRADEEMFFTWQYRMRWAGQRLQDDGRLHKKRAGNRGYWQLRKPGAR